MQKKLSWFILILFILSLVGRKLGFGGSPIVLLGLLLIHQIYLQRLEVKWLWILEGIFVFKAIGFLQYWFRFDISGMIVLGLWVAFVVYTFRKIISSNYHLAIYIMLSFIFSTAAFMNPREFHNFYRSTFYEEYIRAKYTEQEGIIADIYIDRYKSVDSVEAEKYFQIAQDFEHANDNDNALLFYNESIDLNPDNSEAYHKRGYLKLSKLELDKDVAYSAIKDFDRAIRLDSTKTEVYFHRSLALGYLGLKARAFSDNRHVWEKDSMLSEEEFLKKYGISKKTFFVPLHP